MSFSSTLQKMEVSLSHMFLGYCLCNLPPFYVFIFLLDLVGFKYFVVYPDRELMSRLERSLTSLTGIKSSSIQHVNGRDFHNGIFLGWTCMAVLDNCKAEGVLYLLTTSEVYAALMKEETTVFKAEPTPILKEIAPYVTVYKRRGVYKNFYYLPSRLDLSHIHPLGDQPDVVDQILAEYALRGRATVFLHGSPCTGKSTVGYLVAKQLRGSYCHTFNPSDPGDTIHELFNACEVVSSTPLVVVLEEVDCILNAIADRTLRLNADIPTQVHSKATWTSFLDDMVFMKHVVLILTSNTSKAVLDDRDPAMLRAGRVHLSCCMTHPLQAD